MVRLKDIAARAQVSAMTVSKVMHDAPDVSAATKTRIRALAREMGYLPDMTARGFRTGTTHLLGLVISAITNPVFARVVMALEENAHELGYDLILAHSSNNPEREENCIRRMLARRIDGLFVFPAYRHEPTAAVYEELHHRGIPTVILGHKAKFCAQFANIETNDIGASHAIVHHLLSLGHKRIAFLAGPHVCPWAQERFEGYRRALRECGVEIDEQLVYNAGSTIEEGEKAALQMLNEGLKATAIAAVNDLVAIGAANTFLNQGVRIPQDLSLAGFGNILVSEYFRVPLTTIRQPKLRLGVAAMESMIKLIKGGRAETKRLPAEIVIRASTAAPANLET